MVPPLQVADPLISTQPVGESLVGDTAPFAKVAVIVALALPSNMVLPVTSPDKEMILAV